jgi:demethylmenaquinone methyltransferase/2-methoxy-6-polyprenyl-1,4-benzoquinol methylase
MTVRAGAPGSPPLDKSGDAIRDMFAEVAPRYDLLNRLLSARRDVAWRRAAARELGLPAGARVLDLCCGTGDQALTLSAGGYRVTAGDFCLPMLARAEPKYAAAAGRRPLGLAADTLRLPFADGGYDGATVSFGLRNLADLDAGLAEIARCLRPGGRVAFLEFALPRPRPLRAAYLFYFTRVLPWIGARLSHRGSAYRYLPQSAVAFPQRDELLARMAAAGLGGGRWQDLTCGVAVLYTAAKGEGA